MNQSEKRLFLIQSLLKENPEYRDLGIPAEPERQRQLLRGLMNLRAPQRADADFLQMQDAYLQGKNAAKGITDACIGCGTCLNHCPQRCIVPGGKYTIQPEHCLHCGACYENCPVKAVEKL